ncbi:MAG TPA: hypothetical protein VFJ94_16105 [Intrasporangium sp.]|uniref:hypothetical protein n=1 Tax=Intrasporangium sp. TaxID=1925024 RepID=UPI002D793B25|nr:hypothetical protein [Intrasporangium sp.]HET7400040.1 hypothetical protein [Intrasporangium sp.]
MRARATLATAVLSAVAASGLALVPAASAKGLEVRASGACPSATWKLTAKQDNARIEVSFEVDSNVVGQTWRVGISDNFVTVYTGLQRTTAPSGSFEVSRLIANRSGWDVIRAQATNVRTGAVCRGRVTYTG